MTKIEYIEDTEDPRNTGWYICDYDDLVGPPRDKTGPYDTQTKAIRMLRETNSKEWHHAEDNDASV